MASTGLEPLDELLGAKAYPNKSVILAVGPAGIGKEALGYWFTSSGLVQGDFCVYMTKRTPSEVLQDFKGFGVDTDSRLPVWFSRDGGQIKYDVNDLASLPFKL